jgi:hypothetical protein
VWAKEGPVVNLELVPLGTLTIGLGPSALLPGVPSGTRVLIEFNEVRWEAERIRARKKGPLSGDWLVIGPADVATLDIRMTLETDDGAVLYMHGLGKTDAKEFRNGAPLYFTPFVEASDARYTWLNPLQLVAKGKLVGNDVVFEVYALA